MTAQSDPLPNPGLFDAYSAYNQGALEVTYSSTFSTYMEVYPSYSPTGWTGYTPGYYTTATNWTDDTIEFLARYLTAGGDNLFQVYDWSCSVTYPCENGYDGLPHPNNNPNGFVKSWSMKDVPCWYKMLPDGQSQYNDYTAHYNNVIYYRNSSWILEPRNPPADPPLWRNAVMVYNNCTGQYDGVYSHDYAANEPDCSLGQCAGSWWAGTLERWEMLGGSKPPSIVKLGFWQQALEHDGVNERLNPNNSNLKDPSVLEPPYWQDFGLWPNDSWEFGTYRDGDGDGIPDTSDPDIDGDGVANSAEQPCGATSPIGRNAQWDPYIVPEQLNGNFAGWDDNQDGQVDEALPSGTDNLDCDGDGFTGAIEKFVFSTTSSINDQYACAQTSAVNDEPNDRWPADLNDDKTVNLSDILLFRAVYGSVAPGPPYSVRYDLNMDGKIDTSDVLRLSPVFNHTCSTRVSEWG